MTDTSFHPRASFPAYASAAAFAAVSSRAHSRRAIFASPTGRNIASLRSIHSTRDSFNTNCAPVHAPFLLLTIPFESTRPRLTEPTRWVRSNYIRGKKQSASVLIIVAMFALMLAHPYLYHLMASELIFFVVDLFRADRLHGYTTGTPISISCEMPG